MHHYFYREVRDLSCSMASFGSGFTLVDFHRLLQRSSLSSIPSLYHAHRPLFIHRNDIFVKTVMALSWERGKTLLSAAYHTQPISVQVYRALLARMVNHNRYVLELRRDIDCLPAPHSLGGPAASQAQAEEEVSTFRLVPWQDALAVYLEAIRTHGMHCPTRMTQSVLRLLSGSPGNSCWRAALSVLKMEQCNDRLTKPMVLEAARACARSRKWETALSLILHIHHQDPLYLSNAIQSLRPPGSNLLTMEQAAYATFPAAGRVGVDREGNGVSGTREATTATLRHRLGILTEVIAAIPPQVAQQLPIWHSFTTHLVASTTLPVELKTRWLTQVLAPLPWKPTILLLQQYMGDNEWATTSESRSKKTIKGKKRKSQGRWESGEDGTTKKSASFLEEDNNAAASSIAASLPMDLLYSLQDAPRSLSVLLAVLLDKCATPEEAVACVQQLRRQCEGQCGVYEDEGKSSYAAEGHQKEAGKEAKMHPSHLVRGKGNFDAPKKITEGNTSLSSSGRLDIESTQTSSPTARMINPDQLSYALQQPVVRHMLLRKCVVSSTLSKGGREWRNGSQQQEEVAVRGVPEGWKTAMPLLLGEAFQPTPSALLSQLVHQLRSAKQVIFLVRLLQEHIIPSQSTLEPWAMTMMMEAVLAYNQFARNAQQSRRLACSPTTGSVTLPLPRVEWLTALSVLLDRQVPIHEGRIQQRRNHLPFPGSPSVPTPSSPAASSTLSSSSITISSGFHSHKKEKTTEAPLTLAQLRLAVAICIESNACLGALRMIGCTRAGKHNLTLPLSKEITALVYCMHYHRPREAAAVLQRAEEKHGKQAVTPLRQMVSLYPPWKKNK